MFRSTSLLIIFSLFAFEASAAPYCLSAEDGIEQICARQKNQDSACAKTDRDLLAWNKESCVLPSDSAKIESILSLRSGGALPYTIFSEHDKKKIAENMLARFVQKREHPYANPHHQATTDDYFYHNSSIVIAIDESVLEKILATEFLNQFQTNKSRGVFSHYYRDRTEEAIMDLQLDSGDSPFHSDVNYLRPKYAFVMFNKATPQVRNLRPNPQYGTLFIKFKNDIKKRSTVSVGDSLDLHTAQPSVKPNMQSFYGNNRSLDFGNKSLKEIFYYEAQIWGPLQVSDIETIMVDCRGGWPNREKVLEAVRNAKINVPVHSCKDVTDPNTQEWIGFAPDKKLN